MELLKGHAFLMLNPYVTYEFQMRRIMFHLKVYRLHICFTKKKINLLYSAVFASYLNKNFFDKYTVHVTIRIILIYTRKRSLN